MQNQLNEIIAVKTKIDYQTNLDDMAAKVFMYSCTMPSVFTATNSILKL